MPGLDDNQSAEPVAEHKNLPKSERATGDKEQHQPADVVTVEPGLRLPPANSDATASTAIATASTASAG